MTSLFSTFTLFEAFSASDIKTLWKNRVYILLDLGAGGRAVDGGITEGSLIESFQFAIVYPKRPHFSRNAWAFLAWEKDCLGSTIQQQSLRLPRRKISRTGRIREAGQHPHGIFGHGCCCTWRLCPVDEDGV